MIAWPIVLMIFLIGVLLGAITIMVVGENKDDDFFD